MKRFLSLFILLSALLLVVQPVLVLHFCSDKIASVELPQTQQQNHDCCTDTSSPEQDRGTHLIGDKCCHTSVISLSTDEFEQASTGSHSFTMQPVVLLHVAQIASFLFSDHFTPSPTAHTPPEYLFATGRELLTRICILII